MSRKRWAKRPDHGASRSLAFEIRSYSLAHAYDRNLNNQEGNTTYLSPSCRCGKMIFQPMLKVSVLDVFIYGSSVSVNPGLVQQKPRSQTMPSSTKLRQDLRPNKDLIYVNEDIIISFYSSKGSPPSNWLAL